MMNENKFGLKNIQIADNNYTFLPLCNSKDITISSVEYQPPSFEMSYSGELDLVIKAKRHGTTLEKCLYYKKNKKKRIRKKWDFTRKIFGIGWENL